MYPAKLGHVTIFFLDVSFQHCFWASRFLNTHIHAYIHTCMHTCIHTTLWEKHVPDNILETSNWGGRLASARPGEE